MLGLKIITLFSLWYTLAASPAVMYASIPDTVCKMNTRHFNWGLCMTRLYLSPSVAKVPFGACDEAHPNYDERLCPDDPMERSFIMLNEMQYKDKKWVHQEQCQCPEQKNNESPLETYERNSCVERCAIHKEIKLFNQLNKEIERLPVCQLGNVAFDQVKCKAEAKRMADAYGINMVWSSDDRP